MVEFNTTEGEIGVYKGHVPMTVIINPGVLTISEADRAKNAALHAGFVEILQDKVTVLAESVEWPEENFSLRQHALDGDSAERFEVVAQYESLCLSEAYGAVCHDDFVAVGVDFGGVGHE